MIPKIIFTYSWIYDQGYRNSPRIQASLKENNKKYPSIKRIHNYIQQIKTDWNKIDKKVLKELQSITKLKWKEKEIKCYIIGCGIPFSDPLTISIFRSKKYFIDTLIHELIHQLFTQGNNLELSKKSWNYIYKKYSKESQKTKIHVPLHAIYSELYLKLFDKARLKEDYKAMESHPDYKKSWNIVNKEGHKNIIHEFTRRIK